MNFLIRTTYFPHLFVPVHLVWTWAVNFNVQNYLVLKQERT